MGYAVPEGYCGIISLDTQRFALEDPGSWKPHPHTNQHVAAVSMKQL